MQQLKIILTIFLGLILSFAIFMAIIKISVVIATLITCACIFGIIYLVFKLTRR